MPLHPTLASLPSPSDNFIVFITSEGPKKVAQVKNAAFTAATAGAKLRPWSREVSVLVPPVLQLRTDAPSQALVLYAGMFVAFLCSCANG